MTPDPTNHTNPEWPCATGDGSKLHIGAPYRGTAAIIAEFGETVVMVRLAAEQLSHFGANCMAVADSMGREPSMPRGATPGHHAAYMRQITAYAYDTATAMLGKGEG